ncbi:MAG: hypothetical protein INQ03_22620 [Candidatus Heimdallarchaeota archaeon]|nr:hypothetical protein [Candidatus Heimdallarchaeota archaeon]
MKHVTPLQEAQQEAYRSTIQDGLMFAFMGIMLLIISNLYYSTMPIGIMVVLALVIFKFLSEFVREKYTYPRIGYVKMKKETDFDFIPFIVFMATIFSLAGILVLLMPDAYGDSDNLYRVWPFLLGLILFGPGMDLADKSGQDRYLLIGVGPTISGMLISVLSVMDEPWTRFEGLRIFSILWGVLFLILGLITFSYFIKTHPIIEEEGIDE